MTRIAYTLFVISILFSCEKSTSDELDNDIYTEPNKVYIYSAVATPTTSESVTIKNNSGIDVDVSGWTIGDKNDPDAYSIPQNTTLAIGQTKKFSHTTLNFQINDNNEILYLKNSSGSLIDTWSN